MLVVTGNCRAELEDPTAELVLADQDPADWGLGGGLAHRVVTYVATCASVASRAAACLASSAAAKAPMRTR